MWLCNIILELYTNFLKLPQAKSDLGIYTWVQLLMEEKYSKIKSSKLFTDVQHCEVFFPFTAHDTF